MRRAFLPCGLMSLLALAACDDSSSSSPSSDARIDPALVGTWAKPQARWTGDTLIFTEAKYQTPNCSGVGKYFWAQGGVVSSSPDKVVCGEYLLAGDTLYYDGIFMQEPDGIDRATADTFFRVP